MNFKMILNILGWILIFEALFFLVPIITAVVYGEAVLADFLISAGLCLICGGLLIMKKPENKALYSREGYVIVSLSWIVLSLFGALPFYISGVIPNFVDALFETVSGFTTTGATVLGEVETLPKAILLALLYSLARRHGRAGLYNGVRSPQRRTEYAHHESGKSRPLGKQACSQSEDHRNDTLFHILCADLC